MAYYKPYTTARQITSGEAALYRTPGQWSEVSLAFMDTPLVYRATFVPGGGAAPTRNDFVYEVQVGGGEFGAGYATALEGMTIWVGTAPGLHDLGMCRLRTNHTATGDCTIKVGEHSDINWIDGLGSSRYLTIVDEFLPWARPWRTDVVGDSFTVYMDREIAYTNQNVRRPAIVCMGTDGVLKIPRGHTSATISFDASETWMPGTLPDLPPGQPSDEHILNFAWSLTGPTPHLLSARYQHTATALADGRILVVGGIVGGAVTRTCEIYDPVTRTFNQAAFLPYPRAQHTAALLADGRVLMAGGIDAAGDAVNNPQLYDPVTDTWTGTWAMTTERTQHAMVMLAGTTPMVIGGKNGSGLVATCETYDPATNQWTEVDPLDTARCLHTATVLEDGRVLVAGGVGAAGANLTSCELYDSGAWSTAGSLTTGREAHSATLLDDHTVLVAGGCQDYEGLLTALNSYEIYDPVGDSWTFGGGMSYTRYHHGAIKLPNGKVLIVGGAQDHTTSPVTATAACELYTPGVGWATADSVAHSTAFPAVILLGAIPVAIGGTGGSGVLADVAFYDANADDWTTPPEATIVASGSLNSHAVVTVYAPGTYRITCTCTCTYSVGDSVDTTSVSHRVVKVADSDHPLFRDFSWNTLTGSLADGGYKTQITCYTNVADLDGLLRERRKVIMVTDDHYGENGAITNIGQIADRGNVALNGYIMGESIHVDTEQGTVRFDLAGLQGMLSAIAAFPWGIEWSQHNSSTSWLQMPFVTLPKAIANIVYWRSTISKVADVFAIDQRGTETFGDPSDYAHGANYHEGHYDDLQRAEGGGDNLFAQLKQFAESTLLARVFADRYGRLHIEHVPQFEPRFIRSTYITIAQRLTTRDYENGIDLGRVTVPPVGRLTIAGVGLTVYSDYSWGAYATEAPGSVFGRLGNDRNASSNFMAHWEIDENELFINIETGYECGVTQIGKDRVKFWIKFESAHDDPQVHYTINGGGVITKNMAYNSGHALRWEYDAPDLAATNYAPLKYGDVITYQFTATGGLSSPVYYYEMGSETGAGRPWRSLDELARLIYAYENNPYPDVRVRVPGWNRLLELAPRMAVVMNLDEELRGIQWTNACLVPIAVTYTRDDASGAVTSEFTLAGMTDDLMEFSGRTPLQPSVISGTLPPG